MDQKIDSSGEKMSSPAVLPCASPDVECALKVAAPLITAVLNRPPPPGEGPIPLIKQLLNTTGVATSAMMVKLSREASGHGFAQYQPQVAVFCADAVKQYWEINATVPDEVFMVSLENLADAATNALIVEKAEDEPMLPCPTEEPPRSVRLALLEAMILPCYEINGNPLFHRRVELLERVFEAIYDISQRLVRERMPGDTTDDDRTLAICVYIKTAGRIYASVHKSHVSALVRDLDRFSKEEWRTFESNAQEAGGLPLNPLFDELSSQMEFLVSLTNCIQDSALLGSRHT